MYFKSVARINPKTGRYCGYYRLVESYRNYDDRICHRTMLNIGFLEEVSPEQLSSIQRILTCKVAAPSTALLEVSYSDDPVVLRLVDEFYARMVSQKRIDPPESTSSAPQKAQVKDIQPIDLNSIRHTEAREIGAEWLAYQALEQLELSRFLQDQAWGKDDIHLAYSHIISRAVYPASELATTRWMRENSSVCEITQYDVSKITKDRLYGISKKLYSVKESLEKHLSTRTSELFDIQDKIMLYDLTNTYFEGRKQASTLAKFGRSKEKRSDAKLVVLGLVINQEGFIKYSSILEGNITDSKTLAGMIGELRSRTSISAKKALVVIDAGIATEENLALIRENGFDYLCVSRASIKDYKVEAGATVSTVTDNRGQQIQLSKVTTGRNTDFYLRVESDAKKLKESSMNEQFQSRFELGLQRISDSLTKSGGVKLEEKVHQRIGRLKQRYPSIHRYYNIQVEVAQQETPLKAKGKNQETETLKRRVVTSITWAVKEGVDINARSGVYFLRTSLETSSEELLWQSYNTIREIEATFRTLKTDLDLRPVYHKNDDSTMAHLHLGLLAYWVVNTVRHQLKIAGIKSCWSEIVRVMNTQKAVTTIMQKADEQVIAIRRCTEPNQKVKAIYDALKYKYAPFVKKKSVVHKYELDQCQLIEQQKIHSG